MRSVSMLALCGLLVSACSTSSEGDEGSTSDKGDPGAVESTGPAQPASTSGGEATSSPTGDPGPAPPSTGTSGSSSTATGGGVLPAATCDDGIKNGRETGVDCGGGCHGCDVAEDCQDDNDCLQGHYCPAGVCVATPELIAERMCHDGVQNGDETGVDCGGPCSSSCPDCKDGLINQDETDVDCGGSVCEPCPDGRACNEDADCASGICDGICQLTSAAD